MTATRSFTNTPNAVADARRYAAEVLLDLPRNLADEIAVMISELATNCVRHTDTDFSITIDQTPTRIRVEVTDTGGGVPAVRDPEPSELSGRGLRIVRELADAFGVVDASDAPGKMVWFEVEVSAEGSRAEAR